MHGCNKHIGCLSVSVNRIGDGLSVETSNLTIGLSASAYKIRESIKATAYRIGEDFTASANRLGDKLRITCSLVCTVEKNFYLDVVPDYVWLSPDMLSGEFDIISNTRWEIV